MSTRLILMEKTQQAQEQSLLDMNSAEAREFFLKPESYCSIDFPPYIGFGRMLAAVSNVMGSAGLASMRSRNPRECERVNYPLLSNKDGRHAWRPLQLIHPALYVSLVDHVTTKDNWRLIRGRFKEFHALKSFRCLSIPVRSRTTRKDKAAQILQWWQGMEQASIEHALDYAYVLHADIADCYAAIYTHSIAWAIHGKAKANRNDKSMIGNIIDGHVQDMRHGQTNGIPQGSALMDFVAEMVLGYADLELSKRLDVEGIADYLILRYRDDYRIFVNNPQTGDCVLKMLTEVLIDLGLKLNTAKTTGSQSVVANSVKADKRAWIRSRQSDADLQKSLLLIHSHGLDYPNAGSLVGALTDFHKKLTGAKDIRNPVALISIATDIAYTSPRTFPACAAMISKLLSVLDNNDERLDLIQRVHRKLSQMPNTGHMEVWLQRISYPYDGKITLRECLCHLVEGKDVPLWNNDWISAKQLTAALDPTTIVDQRKLRALKPVMPAAEIALFDY